ncbi:MAG: O-methyltransferase [Eubacterium sp.]|nr:O-methyltransferase [Eubacterium sp.]
MEYSRIRNYILSHTSGNGGVLFDIEKSAHDADIPIIRKDTEKWLKQFLKITKPKRILEIGTAVGYSSIIMASVLDELYEDNRDSWIIDTLELDAERIKIAIENIHLAGYEDKINIHEGDAVETLTSLQNKKDVSHYDFIFIDAAKAQYMNYLDLSLKLSHEGTILVTDNIFEDGKVLESHFLVEKRDRTIHDRMREYIYHITHAPNLETVLFPIGDGISVSIVK